MSRSTSRRRPACAFLVSLFVDLQRLDELAELLDLAGLDEELDESPSVRAVAVGEAIGVAAHDRGERLVLPARRPRRRCSSSSRRAARDCSPGATSSLQNVACCLNRSISTQCANASCTQMFMNSIGVDACVAWSEDVGRGVHDVRVDELVGDELVVRPRREDAERVAEGLERPLLPDALDRERRPHHLVLVRDEVRRSASRSGTSRGSSRRTSRSPRGARPRGAPPGRGCT